MVAKLPLLNELLAYENEEVVRYFCYHRPDISLEEGKTLLRDLLAWMWLNAYRRSHKRLTYLFGPLLILDELWHAFILHTRDYIDFSSRYFGRYFHHDVEPGGFEYQLTPEELADFLEDSFEYLGEAWIKRYFSEAFEANA